MKISVKQIDAILPQTQCQECGFKGCLPYAEAMAQNQAPIDKCLPGGIPVMTQLGALLQVDTASLETSMKEKSKLPSMAYIREEECIGCTKCIQACPVDAIIGSSKQMHFILESECTGCGLCVAPCPVDCIEISPVENLSYSPEIARKRYRQKEIRKLQAVEKPKTLNPYEKVENQQSKQTYILEALARIKSKKIK